MNEYEKLKERFLEQSFKNKTREKETAIKIAYADMSRRQNGHLPEMKTECVDWLVNNVFSDTLQISDFDKWHKAQCEALINIWNSRVKNFGTVGRAQKVINMAFKYLFCITEEYNDLSDHCHMTLDSYTLAWYKYNVMPWARDKGRNDVVSLVEWSNINDYSDYILIQTNIRDFLAEGAIYSAEIASRPTITLNLPTKPIEAEFVIWEGQIINERYKNLIKELNNYILSERKKNDEWLIGDLFDDFLKEYCQKL